MASGQDQDLVGSGVPSDETRLRPLAKLSKRDDRIGRLSGRLAGSLPMRCLVRFVEISGRDRILVLAGQAFTAIIPLAIIVASISPDEDAIARHLIDRFNLTGSSADAVTQLFARPPDAAGTITIVSGIVLFYSLLAFIKSLQRTFEAAWELPNLGWRSTVNSVASLGLFLAQVFLVALLVALLRPLPGAGVLILLTEGVIAVALWLQLQRLLLSRRVDRRHLLPGAVAAGIGQVVVSVYSATWMPHLIETNASRYGVIGVTFAILAWLIVLSTGFVIAAVVSAETGQRHRV
jgi:membrane protein